MSYINFKKWVLIKESKDIFGFDKKTNELKNIIINNDPIKNLDSETIVNFLLKFKLNDVEPFSEFSNQIQWGNENGALKMIIGPLGSFKTIIRRKQTNLEGNTSWICKKIIPYQEFVEENIHNEEEFANLIFEKIQKINENKFESAIDDYKNLKHLVVSIARKCQHQDVMPKELIYRGIREVNENNYLIYFEARGHGVEVPDFNRLEQFIIDMSYNKKQGFIRSIGHEVLSPMKQHLWTVGLSDWDEVFVPSQNEEIVNQVTNALKTY